MRILVDADACPVIRVIEKTAESYQLPVVLLCDTNHYLQSDYSEVKVIGAGADAVDFALVNLCCKNDIVVTQDYGLAALCLTRGTKPLDQNGRIYDENNIDSLLGMRHISQKVRRAGGRMKGPPKRTKEQDEWFEQALDRLLGEMPSE